jgi:hypothetical protein
LPRLHSKRSTVLAQARVSVVPLHRGRSGWCCRNVAQNSLTGLFPAFFSSMPNIANLYVADARFVCAASAAHCCWPGRLFGENNLTGLLPANIAQIPTLRQLYAVVLGYSCVLRSIAHGCRNVTFNLLVGDVSEIARMSGTAYAAPPPAPAPLPSSVPCCRRSFASQLHEAHATRT